MLPISSTGTASGASSGVSICVSSCTVLSQRTHGVRSGMVVNNPEQEEMLE